jgi:hypothetical protein
LTLLVHNASGLVRRALAIEINLPSYSVMRMKRFSEKHVAPKKQWKYANVLGSQRDQHPLLPLRQLRVSVILRHLRRQTLKLWFCRRARFRVNFLSYRKTVEDEGIKFFFTHYVTVISNFSDGKLDLVSSPMWPSKDGRVPEVLCPLLRETF